MRIEQHFDYHLPKDYERLVSAAHVDLIFDDIFNRLELLHRLKLSRPKIGFVEASELPRMLDQLSLDDPLSHVPGVGVVVYQSQHRTLLDKQVDKFGQSFWETTNQELSNFNLYYYRLNNLGQHWSDIRYLLKISDMAYLPRIATELKSTPELEEKLSQSFLAYLRVKGLVPTTYSEIDQQF